MSWTMEMLAQCTGCGNKLTVYDTSTRLDNWRYPVVTVMVEPCEKCMVDAVKEAQE